MVMIECRAPGAPAEAEAMFAQWRKERDWGDAWGGGVDMELDQWLTKPGTRRYFLACLSNARAWFNSFGEKVPKDEMNALADRHSSKGRQRPPTYIADQPVAPITRLIDEWFDLISHRS